MSEPAFERDTYPRQKICEALQALASSAAPLAYRLRHAMSPLVQLDEIHFDDRDMWVKVSAIRDRMSAVDVPEARIAATIATMTEEQMVKMADAIVDLASHYVLDNDRAYEL